MGTSNFDASLDSFNDPTNGQVVDSDRIATLMDAVEKVQAKVGVSGSAVTSSHTARIDRIRETIELNVKEFGVATGNTAAANTTALQTLLNLASIYGGISLFFPAGEYDINGVTVSYTNTKIRGGGTGATRLNYKGASAGGAFISVTGVETGGGYGQRVEYFRLEDIHLYNEGNGDSIGVNNFAVTHSTFSHVHFTGFRRNAVKGVNFADSVFDRCLFDFCGSADDSDKAIIDFSDSGSIYWGVDAITFQNCRFENISDQIFKFVGGTFLVNKVRCIGTKFESSTLDGNGLSGTVASFYLEDTNDIAFIGCDFTLQGLQNGTHAIIPAMFKIVGSQAVMWTNCFFTLGSLGVYKPYTSWFSCDGSTATNRALMWANCVFTSGNASSVPTQVWLWAGTNSKIGRENVTWGYVAGGGSPTADSGSPSSSADY